MSLFLGILDELRLLLSEYESSGREYNMHDGGRINRRTKGNGQAAEDMPHANHASPIVD